jgi:hypothetical protein
MENDPAVQPEPSGATLADNPREVALDRHFDRLSALLAKAETLTEAMLLSLSHRTGNSGKAFPGELIQLCRAMYWLSRCGVELRRQLRLAGRAAAGPGGITPDQVARLAARLRQAA